MADIPKGIHYKITHPAHKLWMIALVAAAGSALCIGILAFVDGVAKGVFISRAVWCHNGVGLWFTTKSFSPS